MTSAGSKVLVIMGPTASGKTALALAAAQRFDGEIVSADSMQVYRGLDLGTAKPTPEERRRVPHHLIDILDLHESLDVFAFVRRADDAIASIRARGRLPIVAGGTGFYLKALLYGLDPMPADAALRRDLDRRFDHPAGHEELKTIMQRDDPEDFTRWQQHRRKLIRAYEVFLLTGKSITALQTLQQPQLRFPVAAFRLDWDREVLKTRIAERTAAMLQSGWIDEARRLLDAGLLNSPTAHQAIGYPIIADYLAGILDRTELETRIAAVTWQFARRQLTWFRHQHPEAVPVALPAPEADVLAQFAAAR